ncbi:MAG TPA: DUF6036 family nucleotidyltransferase [Bdellovibrionota bacterium]|nr:DUF6036 family nucleotidyltransferase [Bdellovibrionota bacterium]
MGEMQRYSREEIERLLTTIDQNLTKPVDVIVIGGAAAALAYRSSRTTVDIDTANAVNDLKKAYDDAKKATKLNIPLNPAGVFDPPYNYEDRLEELRSLNLTRLCVFVPELHDLILMKTMRGDGRDLETIEELGRKNKVSGRVLVERFKNEMTQAIGRPEDKRLKFLATYATLFGEKEAEAIEARV